MAGRNWQIEGKWVEYCNCNYGCPCETMADPTYGFCTALVAFKIDNGRCEDVRLDDLAVAATAYTPRALHHGQGIMQPILDERANEAQREALFYILSGADQPVGTMFQIFSAMVETIKDPMFAKIEMLWGRRRGDGTIVAVANRWSAPMPQPNDLSRPLVALDQDSTIIAVVEMSQSSWLVAGMLPGIERQPRKKLEPSAERLLGLLHRWRDEAVKAGRKITRIALAFEAGRDGFWLARWLRARGVEAHVIHASSVAVSREHRRAKTDRLDTELLKRGFLGWLRGERGHCTMARVPTIAEEDAKRPNRERECLVGARSLEKYH